MEIIGSVARMKEWALDHRSRAKSIGLVPTMGFLHDGHISLMRRGRSENDLLTASIFVNPTQFGRNEDLGSYPRDPENDAEKCRQAGVDVLFMPEADEVYGPGFQTYVEVQNVSAPLCGASRPGHFRGVATVVLKLFNMVLPTRAYFGSKDYQQLLVIKTMARDLNLDVEIVPCTTVREPDGLAMSSRNSYLTPAQRERALCLYEALLAAGSLFERGERDSSLYIAAMNKRIERESDASIDYVRLVHPDTLEDLRDVNDRALAVMAVRVGTTRLIDNMLMEK
jgi:pantoate--beta-alanine ligase